jgi:hypothetical protein
MLEALANKVVHCYMKCENVLIAQSIFPSVRIIDFGKSGARGSSPSRAGSIAPRYHPVAADGHVIIGTPLFPGETEHEIPDRSSLSPRNETRKVPEEEEWLIIRSTTQIGDLPLLALLQNNSRRTRTPLACARTLLTDDNDRLHDLRLSLRVPDVISRRSG